MWQKDLRLGTQINVFRKNHTKSAVRLPRIAVTSLRRNGKHMQNEKDVRRRAYKCRTRISETPHNSTSIGKTTNKWQFAFRALPSLACVETGNIEISRQACCVGLKSVAEALLGFRHLCPSAGMERSPEFPLSEGVDLVLACPLFGAVESQSRSILLFWCGIQVWR